MAECYKCFYRSCRTLTCDYILITGKSRGVCAEQCNKYKPKKSGILPKYLLDMQKLYYEGHSDRNIAKSLQISRYTIYAWRSANGLPAHGEALRGRPKKE